MRFTVEKTLKDSRARLGKLELPHGTVTTPIFMPTATAGAIKTLTPDEVKQSGVEMLLGNTYHLHIRPGEQEIKELGGLHQWMNWSGPILTDSGGYQAFSLGATRGARAKTTNEGVKFRSHLDGAQLYFTPQSAIDIQLALGSDVVMVLDDCAPFPATPKRLKSAVIRTSDWAKQSIDYWRSQPNLDGRALFAIVQGGTDDELRRQSLQEIQALDVDGIAIGGVSVGEGKEKMLQAVEAIAGELDPQRPHYLMGVGEPIDLVRMVHRGIDMFDCVIPTRLARHGVFWSPDFTASNIRQAKFKGEAAPLVEGCQCPACQHYSRAYIRHLFMIKETLAWRLLSMHNLTVVNQLIRDIRQSISDGSFATRFAEQLAE